MTGVLTRGNLDTDTHRKKVHVKTQEEPGHLQAEERGLRRSQPCQHLNLEFPSPQDCEEITLYYLNLWYFVCQP